MLEVGSFLNKRSITASWIWSAKANLSCCCSVCVGFLLHLRLLVIILVFKLKTYEGIRMYFLSNTFIFTFNSLSLSLLCVCTWHNFGFWHPMQGSIQLYAKEMSPITSIFRYGFSFLTWSFFKVCNCNP